MGVAGAASCRIGLGPLFTDRLAWDVGTWTVLLDALWALMFFLFLFFRGHRASTIFFLFLLFFFAGSIAPLQSVPFSIVHDRLFLFFFTIFGVRVRAGLCNHGILLERSIGLLR